MPGPPEENALWRSDPWGIILPNWLGRTTIDREAMDACAPCEWLLVVAWNES